MTQQELKKQDVQKHDTGMHDNGMQGSGMQAGKQQGAEPLLRVENLSVDFPTRFGTFRAINAVSLSLEKGGIHGLVGESGAGKSTIGSAVIGLIPHPGFIASGRIFLSGLDLRRVSPAAYHRLRGARISMIFQDPQTSLNPLLTVEAQLVETIRRHTNLSFEAARAKALNLLTETGIERAEERIGDYPHLFSGGMRQRVVIALALCTDPELIIADEPTTALDVAVQKQILTLIRTLADQRGVGFILITHDIGVIAQVTDRVTVLRNGEVQETGTTAQVLGAPVHDYTKALIAAVPGLEKKQHRFANIVTNQAFSDTDPDTGPAPNSGPDTGLASPELLWRVDGAGEDFASDWLLNRKEPPAAKEVSGPDDSSVLDIRHLDVTFYSDSLFAFGKQTGFHALQDVSLCVKRGRVLGLIGESGSGKSTLAKAIVGLVRPSAGTVAFLGRELAHGPQRSRFDDSRRKIQMIFQDPYASLNNKRRIEQIIAEPIRFFGLAANRTERRKIVASVLELVGMPQRAMLKYPHQFSGGQRQRIAIARALVARPEFLICDEPTSALDVSIQAQVLNLIKDLQSTFGLSTLFISHNLAVVRQMSDTIAVLKNGRLVETAEAETFFSGPANEYSQLLLRETPALRF